MFKRFLAIFLLLVMVSQFCVVFAADSFGEDFEWADTPVDTALGSLHGWTSSIETGKSTAILKADPLDGANKVLHMATTDMANLGAVRSFEAVTPGADGILNFSFRMRDATSQLYSNNVAISSGGKVIAAVCIVYCGTDQTDYYGKPAGKWNTYYTLQNTKATSASNFAATNGVSPAIITSDAAGSTTKWRYFKLKLDFNTNKLNCYYSSAPIAEDATPVCVDFPFIEVPDTASVDNISIGKSWDKRANTYYDSFLVEKNDYTPVPGTFAIDGTTAKYTVDGNNVGVSANIKMPVVGYGDATVIAAAYDANGMLIGINSNFKANKTLLVNNVIPYTSTIANCNGVASVRLYIWESIDKMIPFGGEKQPCELFVPTPTPSPSASPSPTPSDPLWDLRIPEYVVADVPHANVVVEATPAPTFSAELSQLVSTTYPDGKYKAFIMSFDDGGSTFGGIGDHDALIPTIKQYGLKTAVNVNMKDGEAPSGILVGLNPILTGEAIWSGGFDKGVYKTEMLKLYKDPDIEVSSHGINHKTEDNLNKVDFRYEVGQAKYKFENFYGQEVAGYARAGGSNGPDPDIAPAVWKSAYFKYVGYRYVRKAPSKNPNWTNTPENLIVDVPTDFYNWNPCLKITEDIIDRIAAINWYVGLDPNKKMKVFFGWGHSAELGSYNWTTYKYSTNTNYPRFQNLCQIVSENLDTIWNPTPIQYVDYINATRMMQISLDGEGNINIHNPSAEITVWLNIRGVDTAVAPGATLVK